LKKEGVNLVLSIIFKIKNLTDFGVASLLSIRSV